MKILYTTLLMLILLYTSAHASTVTTTDGINYTRINAGGGTYPIYNYYAGTAPTLMTTTNIVNKNASNFGSSSQGYIYGG